MSVIVRPLREDDLAEARRIMSVAFGTFIGLPVPERFAADQDYIRTRWAADPSAAFAAEDDGRLIGSGFATRWGSVGFFGPITVDVPYWDRGVAQRLLEPVMGCFDRWNTQLAGLFTFAQSPKHVGLYSKFGFWPRSLTAILSKPIGETDEQDAGAVERGAATTGGRARSTAGPEPDTYSAAPSDDARSAVLDEARRVAGSLYPGLDLEQDIRAAHDQRLGDTVLTRDPSGALDGFAVVHVGPETEAGKDAAYVKFAAVAAGAGARRRFQRLLDAVERFAARRGARRVDAGVNMARDKAFRALRERGYRVGFQGVAMHRPNDPGYSKPALFVIDDWR
jgi:GNAT superfamily N-acetyltransferase